MSERKPLTLQRQLKYATRLRRYIDEDANFVFYRNSLTALNEQICEVSKLMSSSRDKLERHEQWIESFHKTATAFTNDDSTMDDAAFKELQQYADIENMVRSYLDRKGQIPEQRQKLLTLQHQQRAIDDRLAKLKPIFLGWRPSVTRTALELDRTRLRSQIEEKQIAIDFQEQDTEKQRDGLHSHTMQRLLRNFDVPLAFSSDEHSEGEKFDHKAQFAYDAESSIDKKLLADWKQAKEDLERAGQNVERFAGTVHFQLCCQIWNADEKSQGGPAALDTPGDRLLRWMKRFASDNRTINRQFERCVDQFASVKREAMAAGANTDDMEREVEMATNKFRKRKVEDVVEQWLWEIPSDGTSGLRTESEQDEDENELSTMDTPYSPLSRAMQAYNEQHKALRVKTEALRLEAVAIESSQSNSSPGSECRAV